MDTYIGKTISYPPFIDLGGINEVTDKDNKFRFILSIPFINNNSANLVVIMKNPSSASCHACDNTLRKVCNTAFNNGYGGVTIVNLFPIRATKATDLQFFYPSPDYELIMNANLTGIKKLATAKDVVFAWGSDSIHGRKQFPLYYDSAIKNMLREIKDVCRCVYFADACKCKNKTCDIHKTSECHADICYPLHGLRWSATSKLIKF